MPPRRLRSRWLWLQPWRVLALAPSYLRITMLLTSMVRARMALVPPMLSERVRASLSPQSRAARPAVD
jgi:hypothetical protein